MFNEMSKPGKPLPPTDRILEMRLCEHRAGKVHQINVRVKPLDMLGDPAPIKTELMQNFERLVDMMLR